MKNTFLSKTKTEAKSIHLENTINPHRQWIILLRIFLASVIAMIIFSFYILDWLQTGSFFSISGGHKEEILNQELLKQTNDSFVVKEGVQKQLKEKPLVYPNR
jgi:hypothetical protein